MRRRSGLLPAALLIGCAVAAPALIKPARAVDFTVSDMPPPPPPPPPPPKSRADLFAQLSTAPASPRGTPASAVKPADMIEEASDFLRGANNHPRDLDEAAYWLKRAIAVAPDESGQRRAWAAARLGTLLWQSSDQQHLTAYALWEVAAAWNNADALCNLAVVTESGDPAAGIAADKDQAIVWYDRAAKAGCPKAPAALQRLRR
jgi:TPR repeat protein